MAIFLPFSGHALTSKTTRNAIQGSAPYLTFDGGRTRAVDANGLLGITLSNGVKYTPSTNSSSYSNPIELPIAGQSFASIGMLVPTNTNSVALNTLIGSPYNYWGDDDGDSDVTATGSLSLSIVDKNGQFVSRHSVPTICKAPYRVILSSTNGSLTTRYGVPNIRNFRASSVTYYVKPNTSPEICFVQPNLQYGKYESVISDYYDFRGPASVWNPDEGFLTQSTVPSSYNLNFPTTGAHGLYFDLKISGNNQSLYWPSVTRGGITASMTNLSNTRVRVILSGPVASESQWRSNYPGRIPKPTLPQTFELVGRDYQGNEVKYGFVLKQWFVNRGDEYSNYRYAFSWCNNIGYRLTKVKDLTNAMYNNLGAIPQSSGNNYQRRIGAGLFGEWGLMRSYGANFSGYWHWTSDFSPNNDNYVAGVFYMIGQVFFNYWTINSNTICTSP
ncbi:MULTISPECIES: hypothetical protein [unclassified Gilliamella]|uniref:hypothetical protein n=1 Tax=unclassified Gilliamella TaxID=2685620 RepID=UPI002269FE61|nr:MULTISPECIES: hypothetical protein [unclassified Gilliamella]MCX8585800.1 hypothetical protein [Gilliamella sp. B3562]MCX8684894.1 hypothetical protein [Gilliamella sp. B2864]